MLIPVNNLKKYWGVNPQSIVHVGAHNAEELENYEDAGWGSVTWIEAQPQKVQDLKRKLTQDHKLIEAAVWDLDDVELQLNIMTNTESTSLLSLGTHSKEHPTVTLSHSIPVKTKTLQTLLNGSTAPELLALDIQGVELRAIKGFGSRISEVKWIYCEVNKAELYLDCALVSDIDSYLLNFGFIRSVTRWTPHNWGDALYENRNLIGQANLFEKLLRLSIKASWVLDSVTSRLKKQVRKLIK